MSVDPKQKASSKKSREKRPPKKITESYLHNSGLYYLERFAASKNHFKTVMLRKVKRSCMHHKDQSYEDCALIVEALADKFEELGLIDDNAYLRGMVTSLRRRGLSARAITTRLQHKGIDGAKTKLALESHDRDNCDIPDEADLLAALTYCRKKKIGPFVVKPKNDENIEQKWLASIGRQGFSYDIARRVLEMSIDDAEEKLYALR